MEKMVERFIDGQRVAGVNIIVSVLEGWDNRNREAMLKEVKRRLASDREV